MTSYTVFLPLKGVVLMRGCGDRVGCSRYTTETYAQPGSCAPAVLISSPTAGGAIIFGRGSLFGQPQAAGQDAATLATREVISHLAPRATRAQLSYAAMAAGSEERRRLWEVA